MHSVRRLIWDSENVAHIARHQIVPEDVEQVCHGKPFFAAGKLGRLLAFGPTDAGRIVLVVLNATGEAGVYYVTTARPASRKERRVYEEQAHSEQEANGEAEG